MDRLNRTMAGCGLMLLLAAGGCRSMRSEVPPGRAYTNDGKQVPPMMLSTEPHPMGGPGMTAGGTGAPQLGTSGPAASTNYGAPTTNMYGAPGTATGGGQMPPGVGLPQGAGGMEPSSMPPTGLGAPSSGPAPSLAPGFGSSGIGAPPVQ